MGAGASTTTAMSTSISPFHAPQVELNTRHTKPPSSKAHHVRLSMNQPSMIHSSKDPIPTLSRSLQEIVDDRKRSCHSVFIDHDVALRDQAHSKTVHSTHSSVLLHCLERRKKKKKTLPLTEHNHRHSQHLHHHLRTHTHRHDFHLHHPPNEILKHHQSSLSNHSPSHYINILVKKRILLLEDQDTTLVDHVPTQDQFDSVITSTDLSKDNGNASNFDKFPIDTGSSFEFSGSSNSFRSSMPVKEDVSIPVLYNKCSIRSQVFQSLQKGLLKQSMTLDMNEGNDEIRIVVTPPSFAAEMKSNGSKTVDMERCEKKKTLRLCSKENVKR
ncbi:hypothetical protein C9374_002869 [Naegleria lovaniensis]|uniref:Uncharacterized protein n=1 Tax=Naegleria lovaniensis TaxID=51637 RepID=A0AA88KL58_NAELO|nr:uncharacterized protein C9374_002869 [Naegleria lovaniensis]KAG2386423.1 hypothetical protein C9374_002869 [Naegleria lovaniensis]